MIETLGCYDPQLVTTCPVLVVDIPEDDSAPADVWVSWRGGASILWQSHIRGAGFTTRIRLTNMIVLAL